MAYEIERKFLVRKAPSLIHDLTPQSIKQGYLAIQQDGVEIRIREKDQQYFLTLKGPGGLTREETETELTEDQFLTLWPATQGRRLSKDRYLIPSGEFTIELDIYFEPLKGLILAEVEFESEEESLKFQVPDWFEEEVTEDERFKNKNLVFNTEFKLDF